MKRNETLRRLKVGPGGWVQVVDLEDYSVAMVRFFLREDFRLVPDGMILDRFGAEFDARTLRAFPLADVEAVANFPDYRDQIIPRLGETTTLDLAGAVSKERLRSVRRRERKPHAVAVRLSVPDRSPYPDKFYAEVATAYRGLVERGERAPAEHIADINEVPVSTVHRWIREARRRELLGPARTKGRKG